VEGALRQDTLAIETRSKLLAQGWDLELLQARVCRYCAITPAQIMRKGRGDAISRAKALFCYLGTEKLGFSTRQVADRLQISQPAVTKWRMKGSCFSAIDIESLRD
jgi:chromosomal replication initiation ATPase DnaA